jgi:hypothetical protein
MKMRGMLCGMGGMLLLSTGCFTTRLQDATVTPTEHYDEWRSFYFWGLTGEGNVDVRDFCHAADVHEVATGTSFATWVATALTFGIYSPQKIYVTCGKVEEKVAQ